MILIRDADGLGPAIADLRGMFSISQRGLVEAADCEFTQSQLSGWELNQRHPGLPNLIRLANALGYDLALIPKEDA